MRGNRVIARRLAVFAVCVVSLLGACALAWWQWNRYESASGSWQNLGYVLQWPLFGLFPAFMFWRIRRLKAKERAGAGPAEPSEPGLSGPAPSEPVPAPRPVMAKPKPVLVASDEPDDELTAYNRYLAELNAKEQSG